MASVLHELSLRDSVSVALSGRDEETVQPLLKFLVRWISDSRCPSLTFHPCGNLPESQTVFLVITGDCIDLTHLFVHLYLAPHFSTCPHRFTSLLTDVASAFLDIYTSIVGRSPSVDDLILKLKYKLHEQLSLHTKLLQLQGAVEMILASSAGAR